VIRYNVIRFVKNEKEDKINLKMRVKIVNVLLEKRFINKSCKDIIKSVSNSNLI